jgi:hypothetical protein
LPMLRLAFLFGFLILNGRDAISGVQQFDQLLYYRFYSAAIDGDFFRGCHLSSFQFCEVGDRPAAHHLEASYMRLCIGAVVINDGWRLTVETRLDANAKPSVAMGLDRDLSINRDWPDILGGHHPSTRVLSAE